MWICDKCSYATLTGVLDEPCLRNADEGIGRGNISHLSRNFVESVHYRDSLGLPESAVPAFGGRITPIAEKVLERRCDDVLSVPFHTDLRTRQLTLFSSRCQPLQRRLCITRTEASRRDRGSYSRLLASRRVAGRGIEEVWRTIFGVAGQGEAVCQASADAVGDINLPWQHAMPSRDREHQCLHELLL